MRAARQATWCHGYDPAAKTCSFSDAMNDLARPCLNELGTDTEQGQTLGKAVNHLRGVHHHYTHGTGKLWPAVAFPRDLAKEAVSLLTQAIPTAATSDQSLARGLSSAGGSHEDVHGGFPDRLSGVGASVGQGTAAVVNYISQWSDNVASLGSRT